MITICNWDDFLEIAKFFRNKNYFPTDLTPALQDVLKRNVVGRAYYSAFNKTVEYASNNLSFKPDLAGNENIHSEIRKHLKMLSQGFQKTKENTLANILVEIEDCLDTLRNYRNNCDYHKKIFTNLDDLANESIDLAERVFVLLMNCDSELITYKKKKGI
jgi:hypothetical protein